MCRLYSLTATHPTRIKCELIEAQNALIRQAAHDARGLSNPDGWGIAYVDADGIHVERDVDPAAEDAEFRRDAAAVEACTAIAHIRRATVGEPALVNTHPFVYEGSILAHNGHIPHMDRVGERMRGAMSAEHRRAIRGSTDSEHFFHLLLTNYERDDTSMPRALRTTLGQVIDWCRAVDADEAPVLNFIWAKGDRLAGVRYGRSLWWMQTRGNSTCPTCGHKHADTQNPTVYRSFEVASERITDEDWKRVPERSIFEVTPEMTIDFEPVGLAMPTADQPH